MRTPDAARHRDRRRREPLTALYPGTFDPLHFGHLDIIARACRLFDRVFVAVLRNPAKQPLFTAEERVALIQASTREFPQVEVLASEELTVACAQRVGARVIIRGLRAVLDYDYEVQMGLMNRQLAPDIETVFMLTSSAHSFLSSSLIKQVASFGGPLTDLVPAPVAEALGQKFAGQEA